ncbi:hypothetical protein PanWU01x14_020640 [Parasponia andersonii]|uniref:Uncharacterized protein n=1 Tax=Parasponia andersonii TaxID=3476 RepID=A0A2P5DYT2_PARAD|nr:hypothetical protein PanWU01x14_020640 [Parasponia andersonii]
MEENPTAIREALIPQLLSSITVLPRPRDQEECPPVGDSLYVKGCPATPKPLTMSAPHISPLCITPPSQPRPGSRPSLKRHTRGSLLQQFASKRAKFGSPLNSVSIETPHGEKVLALASQKSPAAPPASAFAEYEFFKAQADNEASKSIETEGQLRKELESLRAKVEASISQAHDEAMADFKNSQEFSNLYSKGSIDYHLEIVTKFPEARIN